MPAVDARVINSSKQTVSVSNLANAFCVSFKMKGSLPASRVKGAFYNTSTKLYDTTGITTTITGGGNTAKVCSTHLTTFTLVADDTGVLFDSGRKTYILPIVVSAVFLVVFVFAIAFDCYSKRADNDKYPHL